MIASIKFSVVEKCRDQYHEAGASIVHKCARGGIEYAKHGHG